MIKRWKGVLIGHAIDRVSGLTTCSMKSSLSLLFIPTNAFFDALMPTIALRLEVEEEPPTTGACDRASVSGAAVAILPLRVGLLLLLF